MKLRTFSLLVSGALPHLGAWAHEGHGLHGSHWHATDTLGFLAVLVLGLAAWYLGTRK